MRLSHRGAAVTRHFPAIRRMTTRTAPSTHGLLGEMQASNLLGTKGAIVEYDSTMDRRSTTASTLAPVPVPGLPSLYELPSDLSAVYRPIPLPIQTCIWLLAVLVASWTSTRKIRHIQSMVVRAFTTTILWKESAMYLRSLIKILGKTLLMGSVATFILQDLIWAPSRVTMSQLRNQYWLPSSLSQYRVLQVARTHTDTDSNTTYTSLGVHYLQLLNERVVGTGSESKPTGLAVYLNHGFGASALSWLPTFQPLADRLGARLVMGHDATGFGFTQRPNDAALMTHSGSAKIGLAVWQYAKENVLVNETISSVLLMGHSMGSLTTLRMALEMDPMLPKHIILVSPALGLEQRSNTLFSRIPLLKQLLDTSTAYILRRVIGTPGMWRKGLQLAWGAPDRLLDSDVLRYQWPSIKKGWEIGLLEFSRAQSTKSDLTDKKLLERVLKMNNTVVTVILGSNDRIIPPNVTKTFLKNYPSVDIETITGLGHDPFEEDSDVFAETVERILRYDTSLLQ